LVVCACLHSGHKVLISLCANTPERLEANNYIDGINQTQINDSIHMTFAKGLRAILRQDPDIVMVGEIRDKETAQIAVQASLTVTVLAR
jgi:type IV secretory pathway ATPase VirB11/archaellum biosynthesis ATPase